MTFTVLDAHAQCCHDQSAPVAHVADACQAPQARGPVVPKAAVLQHAQQLIQNCRESASPALGCLIRSLRQHIECLRVGGNPGLQIHVAWDAV